MTDVEKVQLLIGDTGATQYTVVQIEAFLDMADDDVYLAAALALEAWAATLTDNAESEKIGDYQYTKKAASSKLALAARYREQASTAPAMDWASFDLGSIGEDTDT